MDSDFKVGWDRILVQYKQLEVCLVIGMEVGILVKKFFFMIVREYVLVWCFWEGEDELYYCVIKVNQFLVCEEYVCGNVL